MYLLKFKSKDDMTGESVFICFDQEVDSFKEAIRYLKENELPGSELVIELSENVILRYENTQELEQACEFIYLTREEKGILNRLEIGSAPCMASCVLGAVTELEVSFESKNTMGMEM